MTTSYVYAIGNGRGAVKIGWSVDPWRRLGELNTHDAATCSLLGATPATREQEQEAHRLLRKWRIRGEWFDITAKPVYAFVLMLGKEILGDNAMRRAYVRKVEAPRVSVGCEPAGSIIASLGGASEVARRVRRSAATVYRWKSEKAVGGTGGVIPARYMPILIGFGREIGVSIDGNDFIPQS